MVIGQLTTSRAPKLPYSWPHLISQAEVEALKAAAAASPLSTASLSSAALEAEPTIPAYLPSAGTPRQYLAPAKRLPGPASALLITAVAAWLPGSQTWHQHCLPAHAHEAISHRPRLPCAALHADSLCM